MDGLPTNNAADLLVLPSFCFKHHRHAGQKQYQICDKVQHRRPAVSGFSYHVEDNRLEHVFHIDIGLVFDPVVDGVVKQATIIFCVQQLAEH